MMALDTDPDRQWQLGAARGDITSDSALELVRNIRTFRDRWEHNDPELAQALDDGDALYPDDTRRWPEPTPITTYDPDTTAAFDQLTADHYSDPIGSMFVDWTEFFAKDRDDHDDWTIDDVLARGRGHSIFAKGKTGKSELVLRLVVDHVTSPGNTDVAVILDYEMGDADLYQRLVDDFGYDQHTDFTRLRYAQLPTIPPLDTPGGADTLDGILAWVKAQHPGAHVIVIIDTIGRAVEGPENENDTILRFYRNSGTVLRRHEVTWARLDHTGHEHSDRARGGSAKLDDIDIAWELKRAEGGTELVRRASRLSWVPERVAFLRRTDPVVTYERTRRAWAEGTPQVARWLDELDVPTEWGRPKVKAALREAGYKAQNRKIEDAIKYRREPYYKAEKLPRAGRSPHTGADVRGNGDTPPLTRAGIGGGSAGQVTSGSGGSVPPVERGHLPSLDPDPRIDTEEW